jgi:cytochrome c oxidase subunit II
MTLMKRIAAAAVLGLQPVLAWSAWQLNLQTPETPIAARIFDLHTLILIICVIIFVGVFAVMFWAVFKHRKALGHKAAHFHENTTVELIWTVVPFFILIGMAYPATRVVIDMKDTSAADLTIKATGYQWEWGYDYLSGEGEGIAVVSRLSTPTAQIYGTEPKGANYLLEVDHPLVVPIGKKVRILTTAADVIHAWWVPQLGIKQDAIPGFIRDTWFRAEKPGTYRGQCAELCGKLHGFMPIVVVAMTPEDYAKWVAEQKAKMAPKQSDKPAPENKG